MDYGNYILINKKNYFLKEGKPIDSYTKIIPKKIDIQAFSTGKGKVGYSAQWIIQDDKLYLSHFEANDLFSNDFKELLRVNRNLFLAFWFSGNLVIQIGDVISSHFECGDILQYDFIMTFKNGILIDTTMKENHYINISMDELLKRF